MSRHNLRNSLTEIFTSACLVEAIQKRSETHPKGPGSEAAGYARLWVEPQEIFRGFDTGVIPLDGEEATQAHRVIRRVVQRTQTVLGGTLETLEVIVQVFHRRVQVNAELVQAIIECLDVILLDQAHPRLRVRQRQTLPIGDDLAADGTHGLERLVTGVQGLLGGGQILALGAKAL